MTGVGATEVVRARVLSGPLLSSPMEVVVPREEESLKSDGGGFIDADVSTPSDEKRKPLPLPLDDLAAVPPALSVVQRTEDGGQAWRLHAPNCSTKRFDTALAKKPLLFWSYLGGEHLF